MASQKTKYAYSAQKRGVRGKVGRKRKAKELNAKINLITQYQNRFQKDRDKKQSTTAAYMSKNQTKKQTKCTRTHHTQLPREREAVEEGMGMPQ